MPRTIQQERRPNTCAVIRRLTFAFLLLSVNPALTHAAETIISGDVGPSVSEAGGHALAGSLAQASVEPSSGVLRTRLAILVPHARGGPQPGLALDSSSTAGTREAGVGWGLALPVIERSTQFGPPQYQDPTPDPNAAYTLDRFTFNGVPLVPLCMVGAKQACVTADSAVLPGWAGKGWMYFRLETDTASTRIFWSPDRFTWRVQVRGGEVLEFGNPLLGPFPGKPEDGLDFDVFLKGNTIQHKAFRWNLARRWEPAANGGQPVNRIVYVWQQLDDTGRGYLIDIYDTPPADSVPDRAPLDGYAHHTHLRWQRTPRVRNSIPPIWRMTFDQQVAGIDVTSKSWAKPAGARELVRRHHLTYIRQGEYSLLEGFQIEGPSEDFLRACGG